MGKKIGSYVWCTLLASKKCPFNRYLVLNVDSVGPDQMLSDRGQESTLFTTVPIMGSKEFMDLGNLYKVFSCIHSPSINHQNEKKKNDNTLNEAYGKLRYMCK